jgi:DNA topoisomerase-1
VVEFAGYAKYWKDLSADSVLPSLQQGQLLTLEQAGHEQKQTQPPPRYSEPKLVQLMERRGIGRPSTYAPTIATLKQRAYVELLKGKLQPTVLGLEVDAFLAKALPDLLESEFTARMESALDAIAQGQQEWQQYLIGWNQEYFEPALSKALQGLPQAASRSAPRKPLEKSRTKCPGCGKAMGKVPTQKLKKGSFLKCEQGCQAGEGQDLVLFWSERLKQWQLPHAKAEPSGESKLTGYPCPVCQKPLEEYAYTKAGQAKVMLRCSDAKARSDRKHQEAVYFCSQGRWWSPKFGELVHEPEDV